MKCVFFSDTHLAKKDSERHSLVERFIKDVCTSADMVFVVGDLFEFYHGYEGYIYPWYKKIVDALKELTAKGIAVYHLEGNHEFNMGPFFSSSAGVICVKSLAIEIDGKRMYLAHGDEIANRDPRNIVNRALRNILKSSITYSIMDALGPAFSWKIAMASRFFLSKRERAYNQKIRDAFRRYARSRLDEGHDAVVLAHSHMPDLVEYGDAATKKVYLNTGDLIAGLSYGEYTSEGGFAVKTYDKKGGLDAG
jgi:UDP-2,3-diacylglucosamine hydrolase